MQITYCKFVDCKLNDTENILMTVKREFVPRDQASPILVMDSLVTVYI